MSAGLAAALAVSSATLVAVSGPALADADDHRGSAKVENHGKGKAKGHGKRKGKGKRGNKPIKDMPFTDIEKDAVETNPAVETDEGGSDSRDDRQQGSGSGTKRSKSPSWSKRAAPPPPSSMIPLPASDFSGSDLAPERSLRPQTRNG